MSKEFARSFYDSKAWARCRDAYKKSVGGLCEECLRRGQYNPGQIVHHIEPLTPQNINDERIALGFDNLELVCRECHAAKHGAKRKRFFVDNFGRVSAVW